MTVRARGRVGDRPFARLVYASAGKSFSGDLVLAEGELRCRVSWHESLLLAAESSAPADSIGHVALEAGLITQAQHAELLRQMPEGPQSAHLDTIARLAKLDGPRKQALARRTLLQQAIRIFAMPEAIFEVHDQSTLAPTPGLAPIPVRAVLFRGLVKRYSEERLRAELAVVSGARLKLSATDQSARNRLAEYGLSQAGLAVVQYLARTPSTLEELRTALPDISAVELLATVYALLSADDLVAAVAPRSQRPAPRSSTMRPVTRPKPTPTGPMPRAATTGSIPHASRSGATPKATGQATTSIRMPRAASRSGTTSSTRMPRADTAGGATSGRMPHTQGESAAPSSGRARAQSNSDTDGSRSVPLGVGRRSRAGTAPDVDDIRTLLDDMQARAEQGCTHYELLGVAPDASDTVIRSAYFLLAKKLHPDRVRGVGLTDKLRMAQHLFASINGAFNAINKPDKRAKYDATLKSGGTGDKARDQAAVEAEMTRLLSAEEHFFRGERALRMNRFTEAAKEFREAVDKNPDAPEHHASLAWATWALAEDKQQIHDEVEKMLRRALELSPKCVAAHFYRGQIAAANGDTEGALRHFRKVIDIEPSHREAELQVRLLESRKNKKESGGLFDRFRRR